MKKILIVNVNWVGDVIFSTPFIAAVREAYPSSRIACLIHPRCVEVLEDNPRLDELIVYDEEGRHRGILGKARLILGLRRKGFDMAFLLHRSFTKALIATLGGARERIGYATKRRGMFLTRVVEEPTEPVHKVEYFLNIARAAGIATGEAGYEFRVRDAQRARVKKLLSEFGVNRPDLLVALNPGGNWDPKRWPKENYARLADRFIEAYGAKVVITGAAKDVRLAEEIRSLMRNAPSIACGRTTLRELAALLERADLVVANDTGPMHLAVAVGSRVIALFGPTSPSLTGPYGAGTYTVIQRNTECETPCYDVTCADNACMSAIGVEEVMSEAGRMLAGRANVKAGNSEG